jgi:hypothetical protein
LKKFTNRLLVGLIFLAGPAVAQENAEAPAAAPEEVKLCAQGADRFHQCRQLIEDGEFVVPEGVYRITVVGCGGGGGGGAGSSPQEYSIGFNSSGGGGGPGDKLAVKIGRGGTGGIRAVERLPTPGGSGQAGEPSSLGPLTFHGGVGGAGGLLLQRGPQVQVNQLLGLPPPARGGSGSPGGFPGGDGSPGGRDRQGDRGGNSPFAPGGNPGAVGGDHRVSSGSGGGGGASRGPGGDGGRASEDPTKGATAIVNTCAGGGGGGGAFKRDQDVSGGSGGSGFVEVFWDEPVARQEMLLQEIDRLITELPQGILAEDVLRALEARLAKQLRQELAAEVEKIRQQALGNNAAERQEP